MDINDPEVVRMRGPIIVARAREGARINDLGGVLRQLPLSTTRVRLTVRTEEDGVWREAEPVAPPGTGKDMARDGIERDLAAALQRHVHLCEIEKKLSWPEVEHGNPSTRGVANGA